MTITEEIFIDISTQFSILYISVTWRHRSDYKSFFLLYICSSENIGAHVREVCVYALNLKDLKKKLNTFISVSVRTSHSHCIRHTPHLPAISDQLSQKNGWEVYLCSQGPKFQRFYVSSILHFLGPCPHGSTVPWYYIPKSWIPAALCSLSPKFAMVIIFFFTKF